MNYFLWYSSNLVIYLIYHRKMISSLYILQWMLQVPGATSYIGSIGKDKYGVEMKKNSKLPSFIAYIMCNWGTPTKFGTLYMCSYKLQQLILSFPPNRFTFTRMSLHQQELVLFVLWVVKGQLKFTLAHLKNFRLYLPICSLYLIKYVFIYM